MYFQYELFNKFIIVEPSLMIQENKQYSIILEAQWIEPVLLNCQIKWFQKRRFKCEKLTDDGRQTPSDGKSSHVLSAR